MRSSIYTYKLILKTATYRGEVFPVPFIATVAVELVPPGMCTGTQWIMSHRIIQFSSVSVCRGGMGSLLGLPHTITASQTWYMIMISNYSV